MCNKYNLLPHKISVIQVKNEIRIYFTVISKNKEVCNIYLQKMKFLELSSLLCPAPGIK
jgi:hypothetical protein